MEANPPAAEAPILPVLPLPYPKPFYGQMPDGAEARIFTLTNANGMEAKVTEYGAILVSITAADKDGNFADITHGYDTLEGWLTNTSYFGATVGRFGNRICQRQVHPGRHGIHSRD